MKRKLLIIPVLLILLAILIMPASSISATDTLYESYTNGGTYYDCSYTTPGGSYQTFKPYTAHNLTSIDLLCSGIGSGTLTIEIHTVNGSYLPSGSSLGGFSGSWSGLSAGWHNFAISGSPLVSNGVEYAIVVQVSVYSNGSNEFDWNGTNAASNYHHYGTSSDGSTWTVATGTRNFREYGIVTNTLSVYTMGASITHATSAYLNGMVGGLGGNGSVSGYIEYGPNDSYGTTIGPSTVSGEGINGYYSIQATGLTASTEYHFRAKVTASIGGPVYGIDQTFTTTGANEGYTAPTIATGSVYALASTSATLSANVTDDGTNTNNSVMVYFGYSTDTSYNLTTPVQYQAGTGVFTATITGLTPNTLYHYRGVGVGDLMGVGSGLTFTTLATSSGIGTLVEYEAYDMTDTSAVLSAEITAMGTSTTVYYGYEVSTDENFMDPEQPSKGHSGSVTEIGNIDYVMTNLLPGTTYYWRAYIIFQNQVVFGDVKTFDTTGDTPSGETHPTITTNPASEISSHSAILSGTITDIGVSSVVYCSFTFGTPIIDDDAITQDVTTMTTTGDFTAVIEGLTPGVVYTYRANGVGQTTGYGAEITFTTLTLAQDHVTGQTLPATNITGNTATLNGVITSLGTHALIIAGFEIGVYAYEPISHTWVTPLNVSFFRLSQDITATGQVNMAVSNLIKDWHFRYRLMMSGSGQLYYGDWVQFVTLPNGKTITGTQTPIQGTDNSPDVNNGGSDPNETGGGSPLNPINNFLAEHGWDNQPGHWIILIVLMAIELIFILIFVPSEPKILKGILATTIPMLTFGVALVANWLDLWVVILIGMLIAAIVVFVVLKLLKGG